jgi:methylenetetrahydrofolate reductase (NADPH)
MRITEALRRERTAFSFEFFPPKTDKGFESLFEAIAELKRLGPDFVSVTFGAGGSTREKTVELTARIKREIGIEAMAHLTCVAMTRAEVSRVLDEHAANGVSNILALRGDPPDGKRVFDPTPGGFGYANELVEFIAQGPWNFEVGVAGYPEGHMECLNRTRDLENLKRKVDAGASFVITQLFFDNADFLRFRDDCVKAGIEVPISAGIMPIVNPHQIKRFISMCGSKIPHPLLLKLEAVEHDLEASRAAGVDHATEQCRELISEGVAGIHFYTLNKSTATSEIFRNLRAAGLVPREAPAVA